MVESREAHFGGDGFGQLEDLFGGLKGFVVGFRFGIVDALPLRAGTIGRRRVGKGEVVLCLRCCSSRLRLRSLQLVRLGIMFEVDFMIRTCEKDWEGVGFVAVVAVIVVIIQSLFNEAVQLLV